MLRLEDFDYELPENLIAQKPIEPRDQSRLLVMNKKGGQIEHRHFYEITKYLKKGDVLVLNNSKVFPARLIGKKKTGGKIEVLLHNHIKDGKWECLIGGKGVKVGDIIFIKDHFNGMIMESNTKGTFVIDFMLNKHEVLEIVDRYGKVPLPPYIEKQRRKKGFKFEKDKERYQTVYAQNDKIGSVAAPTAGFHFTKKLLKNIAKKGVKIVYVTLHVGLGTFAPVKVNDITKHKMHSEWVEVKEDVIKEITKAKNNGNKVIAVGTTSTRTLESLATSHYFDGRFEINHYSEWVDIFIYPGYKFKIVDAMITNFHLPKSTLLMLVSAFSSEDNISNAYQEAIKEKYRFYSYGDAMFMY